VAYREGGSGVFNPPPPRNYKVLTKLSRNSLKVPKIKKNFTTWNEISCTKLRLPPEPLTRGLPPPRSPFSMSSTINWICWTPPPDQNSWIRHCYQHLQLLFPFEVSYPRIELRSMSAYIVSWACTEICFFVWFHRKTEICYILANQRRKIYC
jgi:hypothetical protein